MRNVKVIVNSTPLIAFSKVDKLELLKTMYEEIYIPGAVFEEVTKKNDIVREKILQNDWIHIEKIQDINDRRMYSAKLHAGEVEVMILAQEQDESVLVVIDDYAARKTAEFLGLRLTGTIGVLIKAKQQGILKQVMPVIKDMQFCGIYFSQKLIAQIKNLSGEN